MRKREEFAIVYGSQLVDIIRRFIEQEEGLTDYVKWRPIKRSLEQERGQLKEYLPIKRPPVASGSTAKIADADDVDDEFEPGMDWSTVGASVYANLRQGSAVLAEDREDVTNVAVTIAPQTASALGREAAVASNKNTPSVAANSGQGSDSGQETGVAPNKDTPADPGTEPVQEAVVATPEIIAICGDSESETELVRLRISFCLCLSTARCARAID
jgi:hypothetical protein